MKDKTPGQAAHLDYHARTDRLSRPPRHLAIPEPSGSAITPGSTQHRTGIYPSKEVAAYLDAACGLWSREGDEAAGAAFWNAMRVLLAYDKVAAELVRSVCVRGRVTFEYGGGVRHWDWREAARMLAPDRAEVDLDDRAMSDWRWRSWEVLGYVMLDATEQRRARRDHAESAAAYERLRAAGLVT